MLHGGTQCARDPHGVSLDSRALVSPDVHHIGDRWDCLTASDSLLRLTAKCCIRITGQWRRSGLAAPMVVETMECVLREQGAFRSGGELLAASDDCRGQRVVEGTVYCTSGVYQVRYPRSMCSQCAARGIASERAVFPQQRPAFGRLGPERAEDCLRQ